MYKLLLVARNEFVRRAFRPSFLILTFMLPLFGLVGVVASGAAGGASAPTPSAIEQAARELDAPLGYVDEAGVIKATPADLPGDKLRPFASESEARAALEVGAVGSYYMLPADYVESGRVVRVALRRSLGADDTTLFAALLRANLADGDPRLAERLAQPIEAEVVRLDDAGRPLPERAAVDELGRNPLVFVVPYVFTLTLYFAIVFASGFMLQSVTEEKENRTIELLLTSLRPWQLLAGKVLGLGTLGLLQTVVWLGASRLLLGFGGGRLGDVSALNLPASVWALVVVYFVLGYGVYASLLAGVGATITNPREGSQLTLLVMMPLIAPLWFIAAIITYPEGPVATALSIFPLTAPVTMIIRITLGAATSWEVALSVALLAGTVALSVWAAARLFRVSTLLAGKKLSPREIARALRA
jgi:ABC-2 type transport system permease protein